MSTVVNLAAFRERHPHKGLVVLARTPLAALLRTPPAPCLVLATFDLDGRPSCALAETAPLEPSGGGSLRLDVETMEEAAAAGLAAPAAFDLASIWIAHYDREWFAVSRRGSAVIGTLSPRLRRWMDALVEARIAHDQSEARLALDCARFDVDDERRRRG